MITSSPKPKKIFLAVLPLLIGAIAFFLVVGPRALNPTNVAWLGELDTATYYLGWVFFRNSAWSFPIGLNPTYGLELSNAILYSDSNPLLAFLFKPFALLLPEPFQYFGIWLLTCFVLQAWFSWKLLGLISDSVAIRILGVGLVVFAPPMIFRMGEHLNLAGHFFIVAALYLALNKKLENRRLAWGAILLATALVHTYLLAMVALVWAADLAGKTIENKLSIRETVNEFAVMLALIGIACWQAGYFSVGKGLSTWGYGFYRMNLLSILDPSGWSHTLKDIPEKEGDYEGFNFLGLGVIFLLVCALPAAFSGRTKFVSAIRKFPLLFMLLVGFTVFSVSNNVGFGLHEFVYPLPDLVLQGANVFRASGRIFWPVFYMIVFVAIFLVVRGYDKPAAVFILGLALVIQIADTSAGWSSIRKKLMTEPKSAWSTPLADPFWGKAAEKYKKVRRIQPSNNAPQWKTIAAYAAQNGLATDSVYLARVGKSALALSQSKASTALRTGRYEPDALYIIDESALAQALLSLKASSDLLARIDGFNVLAPGWKKCSDCGRIGSELKAVDIFQPVKLGQRLEFKANTIGGPTYLVQRLGGVRWVCRPHRLFGA